MIRKFSMLHNFFLLVWLVLAPHAFSADDNEIKVTFFKIGQGNCTLVKSPNGHPPLLVDAGSSKEPRDVSGNISTHNYIEDIQTSLREALPESDEKIVNVIVSHGDKDHYNKIYEILYEDLNNKQIIANFILGGKEEHYYKNFSETTSYKKNFKNLLALENVLKKDFAGTIEEDNIVLPTCGNGNGNVKILSASGSNTNSGSIVLKIGYGDFSFILTGDAEGETTNKIITKHTKESIKVDILQMCHHGSSTEDSNNIEWLQATQPKYAIFSSGIFGGKYKHPHYEVVKRVCSINQLMRNLDKHPLTFGKKDEDVPKNDFWVIHNEYNLIHNVFYKIQTNYGVFSTHDSGHIVFSWENNSTELKMSFIFF